MKLFMEDKNLLNWFFSFKLFRYFFVLAIIIFSTTLKAQRKHTHINSQWMHYISRIDINEKWSLRSDFLYAKQDYFDQNSMYILRSGVGYKLNKKITLTAGFAYLGIYSNNVLAIKEIRPYQDIFAKHKFNKLSYSHRIRIEERFLRTLPTENEGSKNSFNFRLRYRILFSHPLVKLSEQSNVFVRVGNEIFINAGEDIVNNIFDQNWLVLGGGIKISSSSAVVISYNNRYRATSIAEEFIKENSLWIAFKHSIKKK